MQFGLSLILPADAPINSGLRHAGHAPAAIFGMFWQYSIDPTGFDSGIPVGL